MTTPYSHFHFTLTLDVLLCLGGVAIGGPHSQEECCSACGNSIPTQTCAAWLLESCGSVWRGPLYFSGSIADFAGVAVQARATAPTDGAMHHSGLLGNDAHLKNPSG
jgi:hypothetical protein